MMISTDFRDWLSRFRLSRNVCMLIPMEACMGHPVVVVPGEEYLLPFFKVASTENTRGMTPPFAYLRVRYPSGEILTYNNLRTIPRWKTMDWDRIAVKQDGPAVSAMLERYYEGIFDRDGQWDKMLLDCLQLQSGEDNLYPPLVLWYQKLIFEAERYR